MHKKISAVITIIIFVFLISIMWFFINKKNVNEFLIKNLNIANEFKIQKKFKIESGKEREIILPQFGVSYQVAQETLMRMLQRESMNRGMYNP